MPLTLEYPDGDNANMKAAYDEAVKRINTTDRGKEIISALTKSAVAIKVQISSKGSAGGGGDPFNSTFEHNPPVVKWNPGFMFHVKKAGGQAGGKQSPSVGLAHELGHAFQFISDKATYTANATGEKYIKYLEDPNVADNETPIATALKENTRAKYADFVGCVPFMGSAANKPWPEKVKTFVKV